ncbi:AfsR/SARP family transcriptional regulator [Streptomyces indicus]|uniref:Predicted ATPase n=1 Tax=Streptomyces indicus TaxID=417292 RepID=A0A1G9JD02_9ACTN|nr:BTAD domain-containing putative transcriptional regulator [Streptomyces indicus]SDL35013.1 Predicted ATPase [Streptomyces indicus]
MRFEVLGSLGVRAGDGTVVAVPEAKVRALLAVLLVHEGRPVAADRIVEDLWEDGARPARPAGALQTKVSQLRRALERGEPGARALVEHGPAGYRLAVAEDDVDAGRFGRLVARARQAAEPRTRASLFASALGLWRGPAFDGFRDAAFAQAAVTRLEEQRLTAREELAALRLGLGEHALVADELTELAAAHPLREGLRAVQLRALYGAGRQSEALAAYHALSRRLADELGVDPGPELRALHEAMLRQDPHLVPPPSVPAPASVSAPVSAPVRPTPEPETAIDAALLATPPALTPPPVLTPARALAPPAAPSPGLAPAPAPATTSPPTPAPDPTAPAHRPTTNLPAPTDAVIGRDAAVARVCALLGAERLVTLTGPGGVGKTRLALEAARHYAAHLDDGPLGAPPTPTPPTPTPTPPPPPQDGVWLVELAGVRREPADAVAAALGIRDEAPTAQAGPEDGGADGPRPDDRTARLLRALAGRELLLVLDNCEHLVDEVAALVGRLLRTVPGARVLATSQEPLDVAGETVEAVAPLQVPEAVDLFAARAAAAAPGFALTAANREAVELICRRLDGIPLALELAATRVRALGVEALSDRLHDRFRLLGQVRRDAPARQRTLRAMIDWSWELLGPPERAVLRRLAVFAGGFTLDAAEAVCADPDPGAQHSDAPYPAALRAAHPSALPPAAPHIPGADVLDLVTRLVDRSLVTVAYGEHGARYRMLESVTAYSLEQLAASGEEARVRHRHALHYTRLAGRAAPELHGPAQCAWLRRLDAESLNLHTALDHTDDPELALRTVNSLTWYWYLSGRISEGLAHLDRALTKANDPTSRTAQATTTTTATPTKTATTATTPAPTTLTSTRIRRAALALITGDASGQDGPFDGADARGRWLLAYARCGFTQTQDRGRLYELEAEFRALGDPWGEAAALSTWATRSLYEGDLASLRRAAETTAERFGALGDRWGQLQATEQLGVLAEITGDYPAAARLHGEGLRAAEELQLWTQASFSLSRLGRIALLTGEDERAQEYHERAARLAADQGNAPARQFAEIGLALGARRRGDLDAAQALLAPWLAWNRRLGVDSGTALLLAQCGYVAELRGDTGQAASLHAESLAAARRTGDARAVAFAIEGLACAWSAGGAAERAAEALGTAAALRASVGSPLPPGERADVDRAESRARAALGEQAFTAAYDRGHKTPPAEFTP